MKVALVIAAVLILLVWALLILPLGVEFHFSENGTNVKLRVGFIRKTLKAPVAKKEKKQKKKPTAKHSNKPAKRKTKLRFRAEDAERFITDMLPVMKRALTNLRRSVIIDPLDIQLVIATWDPCETGKLYGYASAAMYTLLPILEEKCTLPCPHVLLQADFDTEKTKCRGIVGISLRVGAAFSLTLKVIFPLLRWYRAIPRVPIENENTASVSDEKGDTHGKNK